jgi:hypothetical protein
LCSSILLHKKDKSGSEKNRGGRQALEEEGRQNKKRKTKEKERDKKDQRNKMKNKNNIKDKGRIVLDDARVLSTMRTARRCREKCFLENRERKIEESREENLESVESEESEMSCESM